MKLAQWAKKQGISYGTAYLWFHRGYIKKAYQSPTGTIIIPDDAEVVKSSYQNKIKKDEKYEPERLI